MKICNVKGMKTGQPTRNGNIYPREVVERAIGRAIFPMYGRIYTGSASDSKLGEVSHRVTEMCVDDDDIVVADIEIVATPQGNILHQILEQRQPIYSISARLSGYGSTTDNVIDDGFIITHCDIEIEGVPSVAANID